MNPQDQAPGSNQVPPQNNVPPQAPTPTNEDGSKNTLMAVLCYLGILVIIPLLTDAKNDPFVKFHIKQGLALIIALVIGAFVSMVPIIGWILSPIISIASLVFIILGIVNAVSGKEKQLPIIGSMGAKFHI